MSSKETNKEHSPSGELKKVRDLATQLGFSSSTMVALLQELEFDVKSPMARVTAQMESAINKRLRQEKQASRRQLEKRKQIQGKVVPDKPEKKKEELRKPEKKRPPRRPVFRPRHFRSRRRPRAELTRPDMVEPTVERHRVLIPGPLIVGDFAAMIGVEPVELIKRAFNMGTTLTINQTLDVETIEILAAEFNCEIETQAPAEVAEEEDGVEEMDGAVTRPPVVTVMGHVDHGKTTLLDYIRKSNVVKGEAGGITQHIGAYQVEHEAHKITFIDTPGHEAFTAMRVRGSLVTDIVVLVVDAAEGVLTQTIEALNHAKNAKAPLIVAVNKIDLPAADAEKPKRQLSEHGLTPDDWGGDTIFIPLSAKTGEGVSDLLDAVLVKAEELSLRAVDSGLARAVVLETKLEKGRGPVATVIVQRGRLKVGQPFISGSTYGKVRAMYNESGDRMNEAQPSDPVLIQGFNELPSVGDILTAVKDEKEARRSAEEHGELIRTQLTRGKMALRTRRFKDTMGKEELAALNVIVKSDTHGSMEAVSDALSKLVYSEVKVDVVHQGVGVVTESDVLLAEASGAVVVAFNSSIDAAARQRAREVGVRIETYRIIYKLVEDIEKNLEKLLRPEFEEVSVGSVEVRQLFKMGKETIAGCYVLDGAAVRGAPVKVRRGSEVLHEGVLESLKRFKEDVKDVQAGFECGVRLADFDKFKEGDIIDVYRVEELERTLK